MKYTIKSIVKNSCELFVLTILSQDKVLHTSTHWSTAGAVSKLLGMRDALLTGKY